MPKGAEASRKARRQIFQEQFQQDPKKIPIYLISFNRLAYLKQIIGWLEEKGYFNLTIIDNASTYPPLLSYYETLPYRVIHMDQNYGHLVFWKAEQFAGARKSFYMLSDPDVAPIEECPDDFAEHFLKILAKYPRLKKVGFSLKIDDLPSDAESGVFNQEVYQWEKRFYKHGMKDGFFADIDTTFALYAPDSVTGTDFSYTAFRTAVPYQVRHLPWYKKQGEITEEDRFYSASKLSSVGAWDPAATADRLANP